MSELLKSWIMGALGASIVCAVCSAITPSGRVKTVQKLLCGIVLTLAVVSPLLHLDLSEYAVSAAYYRTRAMEAVSRADEEYQSLSRLYIQEELRAYVLDKAKHLGSDVTDAEIALAWNRDGFWYPVEITIQGGYSHSLAVIIETELGIDSQMQHWSEK